MTRDRAVLVLLALVFALAMAAPLFVPESQGPHPDAAKLRLLPPLTVVHGLQGADDGDGSESRRFWLGTDSLGRDLLPRVLSGARLSLIVALLGVGGAALLAALLGVLAGYAGGAISAILAMVFGKSEPPSVMDDGRKLEPRSPQCCAQQLLYPLVRAEREWLHLPTGSSR